MKPGLRAFCAPAEERNEDMNTFTHKELGLILSFESVDDEHDMSCWMKDVERLPGIRAALVMREVLMNQVKAPLVQREQLEDLEGQFRERIADAEEHVSELEAKLDEKRAWV